MQKVMERKDRLVLLSGESLVPQHPTLLLLHGATDDPSEMLAIAGQWADTHNVFLYSYNFHRSIKKLGSDLVREMEDLRVMTETLSPPESPSRNVTVIVYSYSAIVFRKAVLLSDDKSLFSKVTLIQLVPTAGGSRLARSLENPIAAFLVSLASMPSTAQNPYGATAKELWGGRGTTEFDEAISPSRVQTLLVEADSHSLAGVRDKKVQGRYRNGIGSNVVIIPKHSGVTHENFPNHPAALQYLQKTIESTASRRPSDAITRTDGPLGKSEGRLN